MTVLLQASTLSGKVIEEGRWEVDFEAGIQESHSVAVSLPIPDADAKLVTYLSSASSTDVMLDKTPEGYSVSVACRITRIRHMIDTQAGVAESMAVIVPVNRLAEHVMVYLLAPNKCDPRFVQAIRGNTATPSSQ